jgi:putative membrane-bound dehydrogenase-like protein
VAAEPLIQSPVAFDWGPDGKLWVVEMRDYPLGMDNRGRPGGRIVYLEDTDGDGRYDKATVFLDGLLFPTGVMSWGKGVLVTCAPDIFYAEDTDGDGKADIVRKLFTGFGEANPQHRVNGLRWGLDNWVYCANGDFTAARDFGSAPPPDRTATGFSASQAEDLRRLMLADRSVRSVKTGATYDLRNRDLRIRPDEGLLDPQSGQAQFGRDRDDWGNWFGCNNAVPMWHYALDDHYLRRNPHVASPSPRVEAPRSVTYSLGTGRDTGTPRSVGGNAWTSGCSVTVYRDTLFGPAFVDNWFTCEPVHNLVHREVVVPAGVTLTSRRVADEADSEFLASADPMFTPVALRTGPDGALWVADMYRKVLEHPHWLPAGWEKKVDVRAGWDKGRIYRVYPADRKPRAWPRLDRLDTAGLVALLASPNGWLRDKAQQMLVMRQDRSAVPLLEEAAARGASALGRLHALCTLDGLAALQPALLERALADPHPGVRRHAVRLGETPAARSPGVREALLRLVDDPNAPVRLQLAYSLGCWDDAECDRALARLLRRDTGDPYLKAAALSSLTRSNVGRVVEALLAGPGEVPPTLTADLLQSALGFGDAKAGVSLSGYLARSEDGHHRAEQFAGLARVLDTLDQHNTPLAQLAKQADGQLRAGLERLGAVFRAAREVAARDTASLPERLQAVRLLGRGPDHRREDRVLLADLLAPQYTEELQTAAAVALGRLPEPEAADVLMKGLKTFTPKLRSPVLDVLLRRPDGAGLVLDAIVRKTILAADLPLTARQRLLQHPSREVRSRAERLFTDLVNPDRDKVVIAYQAALSLKGDSARGLRVFAKNCAICHRLGVVGHEVGPDLMANRDKPPEWFLPALFDPSRAVEARYLNYVAVTRDGTVFSGVLVEESGNSITLVSPAGERHVILRANLEELASNGKSPMPEGLEKDLKPQDVADLIAFVRAQVPRRVIAHNQPDLVKPAADGSLRLPAGACEVFGKAVRVDEKHQALCGWAGPEDRAVWTFELPRTGRYAVWLDGSCAEGSAGQPYVVEAGGQRLTGTVAGAGGEVRLDGGVGQFVFRPGGTVPAGKTFLDLKAIRLMPLAEKGVGGSPAKK